MDKDWMFWGQFAIAGAMAQLWGKLALNPIYDKSILPMIPLAISLIILKRIEPLEKLGEG